MTGASTAKEHRPIGSLNGPWSIMFRIVLVLIPILTVTFLPWAVWLTVQQFKDISFREAGGRFNESDASKMKADLEAKDATMKAELIEKINAVPSQEWRNRIESIERDQREILRAMVRVETKLEKDGK